MKSHSTRVPSLGAESLHAPPVTTAEALDSIANTASAVSGMPLSASTFRTSACIPLTPAMRLTLAALVNGGL